MRLIYIGNALASQGLSPTTADVLPELLRKEGCLVVVASSKRNIILRMMDMLFTIARGAPVFKSGVDLVLIDTYSTRNFYYSFLCAQFCRILRMNYIPILHGGDLPKRMDRSSTMAKAIFGYSYQNVTPSGYLLETLKKHGFRGKLIPNTLEVKNYKFKPREVVQPKLLYVRAFAGLYNPQMALHVLKALLPDYPSAKLCMVGPDKDGTLEKCRTLAGELELESRLEFRGRLSKDEWHALSEDYDIFINTTNKDNTPVSVMEAMALGLPVVSTDPGGIPYLIEHGRDGLLVGVNDVEAMVAKIRLLLNDPSQAISLAKAARSKVEGFDWDQVKLKWGELLESCN